MIFLTVWKSFISDWLVTFSSSTPFVSPPELPPPSLTLTPSTRQLFRGERFAVRCPASQTNSSGWMLRLFSPGRRVRKRVLHTDRCSPLGGAVSADRLDSCVFTAVSGNSGLYWCEGAEGRSNAVNITVSCESCVRVTLKTLEKLGEKPEDKVKHGPDRQHVAPQYISNHTLRLHQAVCLLSSVHRWYHHPEDSSLPRIWGWCSGLVLPVLDRQPQ